VAKASSFVGDLGDEEQVRAKLAEVEKKIDQRWRLLQRVQDDWIQLERLREGLLVILGDKEVESDAARTARVEKRRSWGEQLQAIRDVKSIQAQVEDLVNDLGTTVTATELLALLPPETKRETVNWALWNAANNNRIVRVAQGHYAPLATNAMTQVRDEKRRRRLQEELAELRAQK
jgi:hypothetical protein